MSNSDAAANRLRVVRDLPVLLEAAFRAAVREMVFVRPASKSFATEMKRRARFHLSWLMRASSVRELPVGRAYLALDRAIDRFSTTPLCLRLCTMPIERLHAVDDAVLDFLVDDRIGRKFALRFSGFSKQDVPTATARGVSAIDGFRGHLVYDIDSGRLHRDASLLRLERDSSTRGRPEDLKVA